MSFIKPVFIEPKETQTRAGFRSLEYEYGFYEIKKFVAVWWLSFTPVFADGEFGISELLDCFDTRKEAEAKAMAHYTFQVAPKVEGMQEVYDQACEEAEERRSTIEEETEDDEFIPGPDPALEPEIVWDESPYIETDDPLAWEHIRGMVEGHASDPNPDPTPEPIPGPTWEPGIGWVAKPTAQIFPTAVGKVEQIGVNTVIEVPCSRCHGWGSTPDCHCGGAGSGYVTVTHDDEEDSWTVRFPYSWSSGFLAIFSMSERAVWAREAGLGFVTTKDPNVNIAKLNPQALEFFLLEVAGGDLISKTIGNDEKRIIYAPYIEPAPVVSPGPKTQAWLDWLAAHSGVQ